MSNWLVPEDEYRRIKESWRVAGEPMPKSAREMFDRLAGQSPREHWAACQRNIREAAMREANLRKLMDTLPPGDPRLVGDEETSPLRVQLLAAVSDQRHWREYAQHYWRRMESEEDRS